MNKTEWWVEEARTLLRQFVRSPRPACLDRLREHMHRADLPDILGHMGCGDHCSYCSWGDLGGFQLREACSMVSFLDRLKDQGSGEKSPHSLQSGAMTLLGILDRTAEANRV